MKSAARPYRMVARAESAAATGERILDAAVERFFALGWEQVTLDDVARRAGVTVQTVIRRFGNKDGLLAAAADREAQKVRNQRGAAVAGDLAGAVRVLLDHYEARGDNVMRLLSEEDRVPGMRAIVDEGRALHREWCSRVFAPELAARAGAERRRLQAQLVAICDVYTWKLLRRDAALSRRETERALIDMLRPLLEGPR